MNQSKCGGGGGNSKTPGFYLRNEIKSFPIPCSSVLINSELLSEGFYWRKRNEKINIYLEFEG